MIYILGNSVAALTLGALVWIAGLVLERQLPHGSIPEDLRQLARICLGLFFWIGIAFVLAATGGLYRSAVLVIAVAVGLVGALEAFRPRRDGRPPRRTVRQLLPIAALAAAVIPLFALAMRPEISWDADTYHLTLPRIFAAQHGFRPLELSVYSVWPLNTELLFTVAMLLRDHVLAKLVHFGFGGLTLYAIVVACRGLGRPFVGWVAGTLFLANQVVLFEMTVAYVDLAYAFFLLTAFIFLMHAREDGAHLPTCLFLAGVAAGLMAGVKLSGIVGGVILCCVLLPRPAAGTRARALTFYALPAVLLATPWLLRAWWYTGNPFYPFLHSLLGGADWSAELTRQLQAWQQGIGMGRGFTDYLLLPLRVILEGGEGYDRFSGAIGAFWIVALPLGLVSLRSRPLVRSGLLVAGLYFIFWGASSQQMRLLIPILPLVAIASATGASDLIDRLSGAKSRAVSRGLVVAVALALLLWNGWDELRAGGASVQRFITATGDVRDEAVPPVFRFIDRELPDHARLLFINTNHGFHCRREFIADSFFEASQIADWLAPATDAAEVHRLLIDRGITHLLIHGQDWGIAYPPAVFDLFRDPARVTRLFRSPNLEYTVLELTARAEAPARMRGRR